MEEMVSDPERMPERHTGEKLPTEMKTFIDEEDNPDVAKARASIR